MPDAEIHQVLCDGDAGASRAVDDDLYLVDILFYDFQRVDQCRCDDHGRAVLIVVENGNVTELFQPPFNLKAARSGDVLQIDAAERTGDQIDGPDDFIHILAADADRESVHPAESLKQGTFALHHRHTGFGTDIAETEYSRPVGNDGDQIMPPGQGEGFIIIFMNGQAGLCYTGCVSQGQVIFILNGNPGDHFDFSMPLTVQA